jgi:hypothetical protein
LASNRKTKDGTMGLTMRMSLTTRFRLVALVAAVLALLAAVPAIAAAPASGAAPSAAIGITGTMTGTLGASSIRWYQFPGDGASPAGVTMDYTPTMPSDQNTIYFNVDWSGSSGQQNVDWQGYSRIGQGTPSGLPLGRRYWFASVTQQTTYYVELVNNSTAPIGYALALTGTAFPPPSLNPPGPGAAPKVAPSVVPLPSPIASPTPVASPSALVTPNQAIDRSGLILKPRVLVDGPFSTILLYVDSSSLSSVDVNRVVIAPPPGGVVDGVIPNVAVSESGGTAWHMNTLVSQGNPMTGYFVRFYGSANGGRVEIDWSTSNDKGALVVTISGAPNPAPPG